ncbi:unnamed protein product [Sphacelaria rigidula]
MKSVAVAMPVFVYLRLCESVYEASFWGVSLLLRRCLMRHVLPPSNVLAVLPFLFAVMRRHVFGHGEGKTGNSAVSLFTLIWPREAFPPPVVKVNVLHPKGCANRRGRLHFRQGMTSVDRMWYYNAFSMSS